MPMNALESRARASADERFSNPVFRFIFFQNKRFMRFVLRVRNLGSLLSVFYPFLSVLRVLQAFYPFCKRFLRLPPPLHP